MKKLTEEDINPDTLNGQTLAYLGDAVVRRVTQGIEALAKQLTHLVIVSNNVFEDGIAYDASTLRYIEALGRINTRLADLADHVLEVVVGIPVTVK